MNSYVEQHTSEFTSKGKRWPAILKNELIVSLLLVTAVLVLYRPLASYSFIDLDDSTYVTQNVRVRSGLTWDNVKWAFSNKNTRYWQPLSFLSHMAAIQWFGMNPGGHHYMNLMLHALNVMILFLLLRYGTGAFWRSLLVSALFAVHPMNVESVAWIAERNNLLCTFFTLLAIWAYEWYALKPGWKRYSTVLFLFACSLMSKPMAVTLPFVFLLLDYWPLRRIRLAGAPGVPNSAVENRPSGSNILWLGVEKIPLVLMSILVSFLTYRAQKNMGAMNAEASLTMLMRLGNALISYTQYISKLFWPVNLTVLYPHPGNAIKVYQVGVAACFLLAITILIFWRRKPHLLVGWLWYLGTLVPVIGIVQVGSQAMADRFVYVPYIGLFVMIVWLVADWTQLHAVPNPWLALFSVCILSILVLITRNQMGYWRDSLSLWSHAVVVTPNNVDARVELGEQFDLAGRPQEALLQYHAALACNGLLPVDYSSLGTLLQEHGEFEQAIVCYRIAISRANYDDILASSHSNLGMALLHLNRTSEAKQNFLDALHYDPNLATAYIGLGRVAQQEAKVDEAIFLYRRSLQIHPSYWAYLRLGEAYEQQSKSEEALAAYQNALKMDPKMIEAQQHISSLKKKISTGQ